MLTTVVGGVLGYYFQNRAWDHQNDARLAEAEHHAAATACIELSTLMDKRLYRMSQLDDVLQTASVDHSELARHIELYREIRYEWNDSLNRNLARTQTYFGSAVKEELERIYEAVSAIHRGLRERLDVYRASGPTGESQASALQQLSDRIYSITVRMGDLLRDDRVGRRNPDHEAPRQRRLFRTTIRPS